MVLRREESASSPESGPGETPAETNGNAVMNVLIVEDDAQVAGLLHRLVREWGHAASIASTGMEALDRLRDAPFDLVLLDVFLPDANGDELLPRINEFWSGRGIVVLTGSDSLDLEEKLRRQGVLYFMMKPVNISELEAIVRHIAGTPP
jgi:DNA-binding response OmpR family regulator